ncbi:MAG: PHP domain-containing protein [Clostridia bacterium]
MKIDMHIHSTFSDGAYTPERLIGLAATNKVTHISLTDHNTVEGLLPFITSANSQNISSITGAEITTAYKHAHILGYNFKDLKTMEAEFIKIKQINNNICKCIISKMQFKGININFKAVSKNGKIPYITLKDISNYLVDINLVKTESQAFKDYIGYGAPFYIKQTKMRSDNAINLIKDCGGKAFLAHPFYSKFENMQEEINMLKASGLSGIEVYHPSHTKEQIRFLKELSNDLNLMMSIGSDFHNFSDKYPSRKVGIYINYALISSMRLNELFLNI